MREIRSSGSVGELPGNRWLYPELTLRKSLAGEPFTMRPAPYVRRLFANGEAV